VKILFYGRLADAIAPELDIAAAGSSIAELRDRLARDYPGAEAVLRSGRTRAVIADRFVSDDYRPADSEQLELLSPVSGG
jgi:molybdopterin converting factor small subunit